MIQQLFTLDPATYQPHRLHHPDRNWTETNCWTDMMIEVLHVLGLDPVAAGAFTLSSDFDGEQWTLFKFPPEELRALFGIDVSEMYVWRPVVDHLEHHLALGHLLTIEVDAWFLPDTAGITYQRDHVKTGIVAQMLDRQGRRLGYFHNASYFELSGEDFDGIFWLPGGRSPQVLLPYVEVITLDHLRKDDPEVLLATVRDLTRDHLARRPASNPMPRFRSRLQSDLAWLVEQGDDAFHPYAFGSCRQCGANAEMAAEFVDWLDAQEGGGLDVAASALRDIAQTAKGLQFALARAARGRRVDFDAPFEQLEQAWDSAMSVLVKRYDG